MPDDRPIRDFRDLIAWQKARELVKRVYNATEAFPKSEIYGLTLQLRRSAISVPSNIAEGYGRGSRKDYVRFLQIARGSLYELQTQLMLAEDLEFLPGRTMVSLQEQVGVCLRILQGLITSLSRNN